MVHRRRFLGLLPAAALAAVVLPMVVPLVFEERRTVLLVSVQQYADLLKHSEHFVSGSVSGPRADRDFVGWLMGMPVYLDATLTRHDQLRRKELQAWIDAHS